MRTLAAGALLCAVLLTGCSAGKSSGGSTGPTSMGVGAPTSLGGGGGETSPGSTSRSATPTTSTPTKSGAVREQNGTCPYIETQALANAVGSRVGRTTVLLSTPRGCKFYLSFGDYHAVAMITAVNYADNTTAHNQMIRTAQAKGTELDGLPSFGAGVEGILFRTAFYPPDGKSDWACTFRKNRTVYVVYTDQNDVSYNAKQIAAEVSKNV